YTIMNDMSSSSSYTLLVIFLHNADIFVFIYIKSSYIDRSVSADNSELNIELLIKNLKNVIIKKLSVLYITKSSMSLSASSTAISSSAASLQSSTLISVFSSLTSATSVSMTLTLTTSALSASTISAFIISSPCFKKILYRLNELHFSVIISLLNSVKIMKNICVFRNRNTDIILFYTHRCETYIS
ncbi:hypothetical protein BDBG_16367, partial [Blastomyces gilchristii SLH14081]